MPTSPLIHWFRRDLRLADNPALSHAIAQGRPLLTLYIHAPEEEAPWQPRAASRWWLHQSLQALGADLASQGIPLLLFRGPTTEVLAQLSEQTGAQLISCNRRYEPATLEQERRVCAHLAQRGVALNCHDDGTLFTPGALLNRQGSPYRVFTPFWREARRQLPDRVVAVSSRQTPLPPSARLLAQATTSAQSLDELGLLDAHPWHEKLKQQWQPGEAGAWERFDDFFPVRISDYDEARDLPAIDGTSRLAPHLHFGEMAITRLVEQVLPLAGGELGAAAGRGAERFLAQLGWREFARHTLFHFPHTSTEPMDPRYGERMWRSDPAALRAWQQGETGIALVDAGMRELWQSGSMHNRVRMVVGSLLSKNLGIHWQEGARWFWDTLVDADLANNSMGWQWIAGCGVDAAPYFRVFNPDTQADKFDAQGRYRARWLPPLREVSPIIELKASRQQALDRYQQHISRASSK